MILGSDPEILDFWSFDGEKNGEGKGGIFEEGKYSFMCQGEGTEGREKLGGTAEGENREHRKNGHGNGRFYSKSGGEEIKFPPGRKHFC